MNDLINISAEEWDLIENWLDQNDVPGKTQMLSDKLTQIPNISKKIEHIEKVREEIEDSIRQTKIREFHNSIAAGEKDSGIKTIANKRIRSNTVWLATAAIVVVLFGIFWMIGNKSHSEKIFAKNFKPDIGLPLKMNNANSSGFYEGMLEYKQENYKEAIAKWQDLLKANPENDTLNYFLGVAYLALGDDSKSIEYLENQERFRQGIFKEDAAYYAALARIKEGKLKEAKMLLESIPSVRNTKLLNELNER